MRTNVTLSIVIPLYNEEESLAELFRQIEESTAGMGINYEIIFIDDGSTDNSLELLQKMSSESGSVKYISFRKNEGTRPGKIYNHHGRRSPG